MRAGFETKTLNHVQILLSDVYDRAVMYWLHIATALVQLNTVFRKKAEYIEGNLEGIVGSR